MNNLENKYPPRPINDPKRLLCDEIQICCQLHQPKWMHLHSSKYPQKSPDQLIPNQRGAWISTGAKVRNKYHIKQPASASQIDHKEDQQIVAKILGNPPIDQSQTREGVGRWTWAKV